MLRNLGYSIIRLILLIRNYGLFHGFSIWLQLTFSFSKHFVVKSSMFKNPIHLRKNDSDIEIFTQIFIELQYNWKGMKELNPVTIIDAGANIGLAAVYFAESFSGASIYCIEPDEENFNLLKSNIANYPMIQATRSAVWYKTEILQLQNPEGFSAGLSYQSSSAQKNKGVQGKSIQEFMLHFNIDHVDILKMDIEGAEKEIFEMGNLDWLKKVNILVIELHDMYKEGTSKAFFKAINEKFSKIYFQGENIICFLN